MAHTPVSEGRPQGLSHRALLWWSWAVMLGAIVALVVMIAFFFEQRPVFAPSRLTSPLLVAAQVAFPVLGTAAVLGLVRAGALRAGNVMGGPVFGWLAAVWLFVLLASVSASNHSSISWGEGFREADVTGVGVPGPAYELLLMLAPAVTLPLLMAPILLCLGEWSGEPRRSS